MKDVTVTGKEAADGVVYPHLYQFDHSRRGRLYVAFSPEEAVKQAKDEGFDFTIRDIEATNDKSHPASREP